jgi:hypothetical protein
MLPDFGIRLFPGNLMQRPIYSIQAGNDRLYPVLEVNRFLDQLEQEGVRIRRALYPDEEHGFEYRARETGALLEILRTWRRPDQWHIACFNVIPDIQRADNLITCQFPGESGWVTAYRTSDTLHIQTSGIVSCLLRMQDRPGSSIFYTINRKFQGKITIEKPSSRHYLEILSHSCYPLDTQCGIAVIHGKPKR